MLPCLLQSWRILSQGKGSWHIWHNVSPRCCHHSSAQREHVARSDVGCSVDAVPWRIAEKANLCGVMPLTLVDAESLCKTPLISSLRPAKEYKFR